MIVLIAMNHMTISNIYFFKKGLLPKIYSIAGNIKFN